MLKILLPFFSLFRCFFSRDRGQGDLHDPDFFDFGRSVVLNSPGLYSSASANYTLSFYPSAEFFDVYKTPNPLIATIGAVVIIAFTSLLFCLYDFFVRREFHDHKTLFQAKRQFVRFISHEVRTPLNAASLGMQLLQDEMSRFRERLSNPDQPAPTKAELQEKMTDWEDVGGEGLTNTEGAVEVLSDLLNYDKIESGTFSLELSVIPIWSLVERTAIEFKLSARKKDIQCHFDWGSSIDSSADVDMKLERSTQLPEEVEAYKAIGDSIRITQVLRNLLSNALKFTPEKGTLVASCVAPLHFVSMPFSHRHTLFCALQATLPFESIGRRSAKIAAKTACPNSR